MMSEDKEHTSEETDAEMNTVNHSKEQSKREISMLNNETEQPLLEDEEMPTYISVSSPSRREDSDVNNTKQQDRIPVEEEHSRSPYPSDDQGGGSIYVLSSGEESNHQYNYEDEEEEEYADSDEDEEEEDEDDEEEGNHLRLHSDDDEDIDTEYEQECFDRASDDFVLNNRLRQHHKERSLSLQDLSFTKNNVHSPYSKKRHSLNIFRPNYFGAQQNPLAYHVQHKRQLVPPKYHHVESKVKQYIRDIKEQTRRSIEKRVKEQEIATNKNHNLNENYDTEKIKARITSKTIKDYAEKALKDLQREENENGNSIYDTTQVTENDDNSKAAKRMTENQYKHILKDTDMQNTEKFTQNSDDKVKKRNVNGHQESAAFINLRTLSYEEYMHGPENDEQKEDSAEPKRQKTNDAEIYNESEMITAQDVDNSNMSCPLKIENVKSIRLSQDESETFVKSNSTDRTNAVNTELVRLKAQLGQKDAQFLNLRDAYQKTLAENIKMKQELDALRKSLAKYESESKSCETKIASVQTEKIVEPASNQGTTTSEEGNNKISTSSVASTASSIDHWADSAYSPAISIKPPDLTPILNSDDSIVLTNGITPRKLPHPLSRTFITSSRILQTLSNITQGKTRVESPLVRNAKKRLNEHSTDHLLNLDCNSPIHASSTKKRKATDMLGPSTFAQPFKIPHTTVESDKRSSNDTTETELKYTEEHTSSKTEKEDETTSVHKNGNDSASAETKREETEDHDDNVKCFIYRDEENSKNRSFLIQAEEATKDGSDSEKNRIQECGPYLLGNLEVRMSEINGTISIWGKEINQESASDNEDEMEVSARSTDKKSYHCWPNASQSRFNGSPLVCSTNKKQKIPLRLNRSHVSQCCQSTSLKTASMMEDVNDKRHSCSPSTSVRTCENCDSSKYRKEWSMCKSASSSQEKLHSCCSHHTEIVEKECNCCAYHERQKYDASPKCCKDKCFSRGCVQRVTCRNTLDSKNHLHESILNATADVNDAICKCHTNVTCRRSLPNIVNGNSPRSGCCSHIRDVPSTCKSSSDNISRYDNSDKHTCKSVSTNDGEDVPLIPFKRSNETPEARQRRLSGKRVRGILMDLLRGCGDCRSNSGAGLTKSGMHQKETAHTVNSIPQIKVTPAATPEAACSSSTQCNDRCCHAYARRIESQLEEFRMEMERVRSRSDAILDMLNMLHSVDMN